jgi:HPt (histidine-containing phosphotransfer) domain-containing protein
MPVMDGFTATQLLRKHGFKRPIVALTANAMKGFEQTILQAGCSHYLTKPIDIDLLLQTLAGLLNGRRVAARERPEVRREPAHVEPQTARAPAVEQPRPGDGAPAGPPIVSRLASHPKLRAVVRKFALQMPERMSAIEAAWQARDYPTLAGLAHWLKGSGGTAGFDAFTTPARTLEQLAKAADEAAIAAVIVELRSLVDRVVPPAETEDVPLARVG